MNHHKLYANLILSVHVLIILLNLSTLPIIFLFPALRIWAVAFIAVTPLLWVVLGKGCFLTTWENHHRAQYDKNQTYTVSCIPHYSKKWFLVKVTNLQVVVFLWSYLVLVIYSAVVLMRLP